ncbi:MAG: phage/plasmid primase, P4 family [Desulfocurvibacter africanus]
MGWAGKHLSESDRERIARGLFEVDDSISTDEWLNGKCPLHDDQRPSFGYNFKQDVFHCQAGCSPDGDLISLYCQVHQLDAREGFKDFKAKFGQGADEKQASRPAKPRKTEQTISEDVWQQMPPLPQAWLEKLAKVRGWSSEALRRMDVRMQGIRQRKDGSLEPVDPREARVAIPVRDTGGKLRNIRLYKPGGDPKIISWAKAFGSARLFPAQPRPDETILLCEGEPDTLCALSHGFNAITQTSKTNKIPQDQLAKFRGRDVVICYDADRAGQSYAAKHAKALADAARSVRLLTWPDFMGRLPDGDWPKDHGEDLTDFFVKHGKRADDLRELIAQAEPFGPPSPSDAGPGQFFAMGLGGRVSFKPRMLAERVVQDVPLLNDTKTGALYRWNGRYFEDYAFDQVRLLCLRYLANESTQQRINDAAGQARILSTIPHGRQVNDRDGWVCVRNGMLNLQSLEVAAHAQDFYATYELGVEFNPDSGRKCERWLRYLEMNVQTPRAIAQLQEFFGYCLTRDTRYQKCLILFGPGEDGKSIALNILREMVGAQNCAAVTFRDLEDQFHRATLYNKLLNISTELGSDALESQYFKAIVSGDPINAAFKHQDAFEFKPFCKLAYATNKLPRVLDNSHGYFRRLLPISFKRQFLEGDPDRDPYLESKLLEELSEIFQWSLVGLHRLIKQGRFTDCEETQDLLLDYKRLNNPVLAFAEDRCALGDGYSVKKDDLYDSYRDYCRKSGYSIMHKENFFRELYAAVNTLRAARPRIDGRREWRIEGIAIASEFTS